MVYESDQIEPPALRKADESHTVDHEHTKPGVYVCSKLRLVQSLLPISGSTI